ncbi:hypothetical protein FRC02_004994 [Tulasnella sp. 418]|nr:hypothetical protein FRC02_004994 [Tulasnella sp. 418]
MWLQVGSAYDTDSGLSEFDSGSFINNTPPNFDLQGQNSAKKDTSCRTSRVSEAHCNRRSALFLPLQRQGSDSFAILEHHW